MYMKIIAFLLKYSIYIYNNIYCDKKILHVIEGCVWVSQFSKPIVNVGFKFTRSEQY